jgi:hypothetical protein
LARGPARKTPLPGSPSPGAGRGARSLTNPKRDATRRPQRAAVCRQRGEGPAGPPVQAPFVFLSAAVSSRTGPRKDGRRPVSFSLGSGNASHRHSFQSSLSVSFPGRVRVTAAWHAQLSCRRAVCVFRSTRGSHRLRRNATNLLDRSPLPSPTKCGLGGRLK